MDNIEHHPWGWNGPGDSRILIAGTFPPTGRNWSFDFFYPNKRNLFWKILSDISGSPLEYGCGDEAVTERKGILQNLKITITDMGRSVIRKENNSLDENLEAIEYMDILQILRERPLVKKILLTSSSGRVSALRWFQNYLDLKGVKHKFPKTAKPWRTTVYMDEREIEVVVLYSPSARAAGRLTFSDLADMYRREITS